MKRRSVLVAIMVFAVIFGTVGTVSASSKPKYSATWQGGKSTLPPKYADGYVSSGELYGFVSSFKLKKSPFVADVPNGAYRNTNWSVSFTVKFPDGVPIEGTYEGETLAGLGLGTAKSTIYPVGDVGTVTITKIANGKFAGKVAVDDGYMSVNVKFSGKYKEA